MRKKIVIHIVQNKNSRNEMHFEVQKKTRSNVFRPKKGKGSYRRRGKHRNEQEY